MIFSVALYILTSSQRQIKQKRGFYSPQPVNLKGKKIWKNDDFIGGKTEISLSYLLKEYSTHLG